MFLVVERVREIDREGRETEERERKKGHLCNDNWFPFH